MPVDQRVKAGKIWPILVEAATAKTKMTYGDLGPRVNTVHRNLNPPLDVIAKYCKRMSWPPLTVVISNEKGAPAPGHEGEEFEGALNRVYGFDWSKVKNPFELFASTK